MGASTVIMFGWRNAGSGGGDFLSIMTDADSVEVLKTKRAVLFNLSVCVFSAPASLLHTHIESHVICLSMDSHPTILALCSTSGGGERYTVQRGDTLTSIASDHHTTREAIMQQNPSITNPKSIFPGQIILVFSGEHYIGLPLPILSVFARN